ncbi:MAG: tetratricopeptide repeat protein, partial [bacterium]
MPKEEDELRDLERKWAQNPDSMIFVQLADAYRRSGNLERSVESCLKGLARHPTYATARIILGRDYFDLGKWDEAAAEFRRVEAVDADNILVHRMMGQIALRQGRTTEAISRQQRVLALDPDDVAAQDLLRQALLQAKQPEGPGSGASKPTSSQIATPLPSSAPLVSRTETEPIQAVENHDKALKVADIYTKKRAWDQAEEVLSEILALSPDYGPALERRRAIEGLRANEGAKRKADEETKRKATEEAKRKADEEAKRKADEEAKRKADEETKRKADEEAKRKADEEAKRKADEEAKRKADEEAKRKA